MSSPSEEEVAREMERITNTPVEERDPERTELMRALWQQCILSLMVGANGPAMDLLTGGVVSEETLLNVIRKAALDSLIGALVTLDNAQFTPGLAESVFTLGDATGMDGLPFNY